MSDILWRPTPEFVEHTRVTAFMRKHSIRDTAELLRRSAEDTTWFWDAAVKDMGVRWFKPYTKVQDSSKGFPWTQWFLDGKLNIVANCLDPRPPDRPAIIGEADDGAVRTWTYGELNAEASKVAGLLRKLGVGKGDAVGIYMPMVPEIVAAFFGSLKIGAVPVPVFSAFAAPALAVRLQDAEAKVLFTADGVSRRGKQSPIKPEADKAVAECPSVRNVVVLRRLGIDVPTGPKDLWWHDAVGGAAPETRTAELEAEDTSFIIYTSGTTGKPKGTVHTHAGAVAKIGTELGYNFDVREGDVFFWVTDMGWMMGPWELVGVTFYGGTIVIFEGAPNHPDPGRLWNMVQRHTVTHLGISPTAIRLLKSESLDWVTKHDLSSLRILGSTGEPWDPDSYRWFLENIGGGRCPIINISGGTELCGSHLAPLPTSELKSCTVRGPCLGMDVDVFDDDGKPIRGGIGHLVCKKPAPSMTKGFLKDPDRYLQTYFSKFPDVWYHGDWAKIDEDGFWFLFGRSDDTIKVAGKRTGPAEIEGALIEHAAVAEAAAVGVPHEVKGEGVACFVVLNPGHEPSEPLRAELGEQVVKHLGKTLRPETLKFVRMLPKTRSGKIVRGTIKKRFLGQPVGDTASVENPDAIEEIARAT